MNHGYWDIWYSIIASSMSRRNSYIWKYWSMPVIGIAVPVRSATRFDWLVVGGLDAGSDASGRILLAPRDASIGSRLGILQSSVFQNAECVPSSIAIVFMFVSRVGGDG